MIYHVIRLHLYALSVEKTFSTVSKKNVLNARLYLTDLLLRANSLFSETGFFQFPSAIPISVSTHSGEDVAIYANGPMSHLINGVKEQSYIAFALAYSACIGPYGWGRQRKFCLRRRKISLH